MSSTARPLLNPYNPVCVVTPCLQQVIGQIDRNPVDQFSACVALFGSPVISAVTPSADVVFETETATVSYTDIIVSLTTQVDIVDETATASTEITETVTDFPTIISTVTSIVLPDAQSTSFAPVPKRRRRRSCGSKPSTSSSDSTAPSSTSLALFPIASDCPSLEQYSSACACITAVATTQTVTYPAPTIVSVISETVSTDVPVISLSTIQSVVTDTVTDTVTSTSVATVTSSTTSTTTLTLHLAPTQSSTVSVGTSGYEGDTVEWNSQYVGVSPNASPPRLGFVTDGGQPWIIYNGVLKYLYICDIDDQKGPMSFIENQSDALAQNCEPVTCSVATDGQLSCQATNGYYRILDCYWGLYLGAQDFTDYSQSPCNREITLLLTTLDMY